jgi:O-methyltransferase
MLRKRIARSLRGGPPPSQDEQERARVERDLSLLAEADRAIVERALPFTMTGVARLHALIEAVRHCVRAGVPGAFAECGVWRGGSVLAMILALQEQGVGDRDVYLYDTFEGMTEPTEVDVSAFHPPALDLWQESSGKPWPELFDSGIFNEDLVRLNLEHTGYPGERLHFVRGPVEETIPAEVPDALALLRLDTDWYESTRHELLHLYPLLASGGVLIVDDYGHWEGSRRAVDEYFSAHTDPVLLAPIDYAGRLAVKR